MAWKDDRYKPKDAPDALERVNERGLTHKVFGHPEDLAKRTLVSFLNPVHYDNGGTWETIDERLVPSTDPDYEWEVAENEIFIMFQSTQTRQRPYLIGFGHKLYPNHTLGLGFGDLYWTNDEGDIQVVASFDTSVVPTKVDDFTLHYIDAYGPGTTLEFGSKTDGWRKFLHINNKFDPPSETILAGTNPRLALSMPLDLPQNVVAKTDTSTWDKTIDFLNDKATQFVGVGLEDVPLINVMDPIIEAESGSLSGVYHRFWKDKNDLVLNIEVPASEVQFADFPLRIDSSTTLYVNTSYADGDEKTEDGTVNRTRTTLYTGQTGKNSTYISYMRFASVPLSWGYDVEISRVYGDMTYFTGSQLALNGRFVATDSAGTLAGTTSEISNMTQTNTGSYGTAYGSLAAYAYGAMGSRLEVSLQEILNRSGWSSGNNIGFIAKDASGASSTYAYPAAYEHGSEGEPYFQATYYDRGSTLAQWAIPTTTSGTIGTGDGTWTEGSDGFQWQDLLYAGITSANYNNMGAKWSTSVQGHVSPFYYVQFSGMNIPTGYDITAAKVNVIWNDEDYASLYQVALYDGTTQIAVKTVNQASGSSWNVDTVGAYNDDWGGNLPTVSQANSGNLRVAVKFNHSGGADVSLGNITLQLFFEESGGGNILHSRIFYSPIFGGITA